MVRMSVDGSTPDPSVSSESGPKLCRFLGRRCTECEVGLRSYPASEKRQGTKSRDVKQGRFCDLYGDLNWARGVAAR